MATNGSTSALIDQAQVKAQEFEALTLAVLSSAQEFEITTSVQYVSSGELLREIKAKAKALDDERKSITRPLDEAKARIMELFRPATDQLEQAERTIKSGMLSFEKEEERRRRQLEEEQRVLAAKEVARLQGQADRARVKGNDEKAEDLEAAAASVPVPIVPSETPVVSGISTREVWKAEVTDFEALVLFCATGKGPLALLLPNMRVLDAQARSLKNELNILGVRAVPEKIVAARGR